jgi:4'-phosphopantetheinyl transferase
MYESVEVVLVRLDAGVAEARAGRRLLCADERRRAAQFKLARDRRRYIAARSALRRLLGERLGERPEAIELVYGRRGKPALAPRLAASGLHFNLAHCDDVALYAFTHEREVGIDIEAVRALSDADDVAARFFSPYENLAYRSLASAHRAQGFFNCWTRKEAFIKALGGGLHIPLGSFDVSLSPGEPARILRVGREPGDSCGWLLMGLEPAPGWTGALVVRAQAEAATADGYAAAFCPRTIH